MTDMLQPAMARKTAEKTPRKVKGARRTALLDAAEDVFSRRGYYGATLRDIADTANVNLGLMSYYFKTKEELIRHVVQRRVDELAAATEANLAAALAQDGPATLRNLIAAFVRTMVTFALHPDEGWRNYMRLISRLMNAYAEDTMLGSLRGLADVGDNFADKCRSLLPDVPDADVYLGVYIIESSLIYVVQDPGLLPVRTRGLYKARDLEPLIEYLARFYAGGLDALTHA